MDAVTCFSCTRDETEDLPFSLLEDLGITAHSAHSEAESMARVCMARAAQNNDVFCRIPFCVTVEAEAFGAIVDIPDDGSAPGSARFIFNAIEQLADLRSMDLTAGRIDEVLNCIEIMTQQEKKVCLGVEGPFTILSFLIDSSIIFKSIIKNRQFLDQALTIIEESLVTYITAAFQCGAEMVSYADPAGAMQYFGLDLYKDVVGRSSYRILRRLESAPCIGLVHLCGQSSLSFVKAGFCRAIKVEVPGAETYGQSLQVVADRKTPVLLGHNCMKNTHVKMKKPIVWQIELN